MKRWTITMLTGLLLGEACLVSVLTGCGADQPIEPSASSLPASSPPVPQTSGFRGQAPPGSDMVNAVEPSAEEKRVTAFQQQLDESDPVTRQNLLMDGIYSPDPTIRLMALNALEPMVTWNSQVRSQVEQALQYETNSGMQMRMNDLLAKEVSPDLLQATDANAAQN